MTNKPHQTAQEMAAAALDKPSEMSMTKAGCKASTDEIADAVNQVFRLLATNWPRKFPSIWKSEKDLAASKRMWFRVFSRCQHLTPVTLAAGLERLPMEWSWPADNPGEFLAMCHVEHSMVGAPDPDRAFSEACRGAYPYNQWHRWSSKAVYWGAVWTGLSDLNERPNASRKRFDREYQKALDQFEDLPDAPIARLDQQRAGPVEPDLNGEGFQEFLAMKKKLGLCV